MNEGEAEPRPGATAELVLDNHRVTGELHYGGAPRRLVDVLNATEGAFLLIRNGVVRDHDRSAERPRRFQLMHVHLNAILFAIPGREQAQAPSPFEVVSKVRSRATIVLAGFEISGDIHLAPDANPSLVPLLGSGHFLPVTNAQIAAVGDGDTARSEPIVVVNLARAQAYTPGGLTAD